MIRNASKIWGYPDVQDINSFDPVLGLILGALAEELHTISGEINKADSRVVEKLLDVLFSQNMFTHFPAHAVACAKPVQPRVTIGDYYQFYFSKEVHGPADREGTTTKKNIWFTPTNHSVLFSGEVKYLFAGKYVYEMDGPLKEIVAEAPRNPAGSSTSLLLGVRLSPLVELLDGLSLFFSFKNIQTDDRFYHALHNAKWKLNGKEVAFYSGLQKGDAGGENSLAELLKRDSNISYKAGSFINDFYGKNFMTLGGDQHLYKDFMQEDFSPPLFDEDFRNNYPSLYEKDILWIEIDMSLPLSVEEINDLVISLNCFPVINRELNEYTHSIVKGTNVIPLLTDDLFFDVKRVSDSKDLVYTPRTSVHSDSDENKSYLVRQGGIARFDSRDARETIGHLIDLVRDEAAAFSVKGTDLISFELKQLEQILTRLQQRIGTSAVANDLNSYLILGSNTDYDKISVQFWSVAGEEANNIRSGSLLSVYRGSDLNDKSVKLFTQTTGGRQKLSKEDKLNALRRSMLSKGRIVTAEDIKALCFELFGASLKTVEVKKGVSIHHSAGKGMSRTLDVLLYLDQGNELPADELKHKTESLKIRLKQESANLLPYRIFIK